MTIPSQHYLDQAAHDEILSKAKLSLTDLASGGVLNDGQAKKFWIRAIKQSKLLQMATTRPMKGPNDVIDKLKFGSRIMHRLGSGQALSEAQRSKPTTSKTTLPSDEFVIEVRLPYAVLEDNIEQKSLTSTVQGMMLEAMKRDMEEVLIEGNTGSSDNDLAGFDGLLAQITTNTVNAGGNALSQTYLESALRVMPQQYLRDKSKFRFLTSHKAEMGYRADLASRATTLGDRLLTEDIGVGYQGVPIEAVPMMPEDLTATYTACVLMDPKNFIVGMWRNIMFEMGKDISAREVIMVYSVRFGCILAEEDATVEIYDVETA